MAPGLGWGGATGGSRPLSKADLHPQPKGNILNQSFLVFWKNQCEREGRFLRRSDHHPDHLPLGLAYPVKEGYGLGLNPSWDGWVGVGGCGQVLHWFCFWWRLSCFQEWFSFYLVSAPPFFGVVYVYTYVCVYVYWDWPQDLSLARQKMHLTKLSRLTLNPLCSACRP